MTLVFDSKAAGPGTHALIVASGHVPHYPKAGTAIAANTGRLVADWLIERFRNPEAALASVDFLAAEPGGARVGYRAPGAGKPVAVEPPRFASFKAALERWRARLDADPGNIAFFYYAGYVFRPRETLLALQDTGATSFRSFEEAMRGCRADRHFYLVDGISLDFGSVVEGLQPRTFAAPPRHSQSGRVVIQADSLADGASRVTAVASALLALLDQPPGTSPVSVRRLAGRLKQTVTNSARVVSINVTGDFELHYPVAPRAGAPKGGGAGGTGGKPRTPAGRGKTRKKAAPAEPAAEAVTDFVPDDAEAEHDALGRSVLAVGLARRLHKIWRNTNRSGIRREDPRAAFVVHLDAPWGGGKTTFANFVARVLDPVPDGRGPAASFLTRSYPGSDIGGIFLDDPPADDADADRLAELSDDERRPWIVVNFNAWQAEHCAPPWWVFYQAIRKGCFDAVRRAGTDAWRPLPPLPSTADDAAHRRRDRAIAADRAVSRRAGLRKWAMLWAFEYGWRLLNPKILVLLATAAVSLVLLVVLAATGVWGIIQGERGAGVGYILANPAGIFLAGLSGVTGLWALGALVTESIVPGTDTLAERLSLGGGDPFARFRRHFAHTVARVRRPVMVIIDDLDRCRPDFVVDLVRGIQTLLRSPRVVFMILGDRDWIERAFEAHHQAMKEVDVGPEQSFGARFVEKAIQLSFILPALGKERRSAYVRRVLLGERAERQPPSLTPEQMAKVREIVNREAAKPKADQFAVKPLAKLVREELEYKHPTLAYLGRLNEEVGLVNQLVADTLAIRAAAGEKAEHDIRHELEQLAGCFPANPRQIKRIVNAITIYSAALVALGQDKLTQDPAFRAQLALWVIIMTEWPQTWRLLVSFPGLADMLAGKRLARGTKPPGSARAIARTLDRIRADGELTALITGVPAGGRKPRQRLETASIAILAELTPLYSRKRRLPEEDETRSPRRRAKRKPKSNATPVAAGN